MTTPIFENPATLLTPPGPYSQVVRVGELAFVSGQVGATADGRLVGQGVAAQCDQALANVAAALDAVGLTLGDIVKLTIFVASADDMAELVPHMDVTFPRLFPGGLPASSLVIVERLFEPALRIEIEAIAHE
ncbi:RidA family protein [Microbacterium oryzae]|uniref:RidA family protein n=1 Tax=Microbacterium oryzae TaxID=743009 RepID=UPI0025AFA84B|nr:RidA family protein [Microbacterium oryzae]MDN3310196.1 RidA family protein [Microbacterium oryzae]